MRHIAIKEKTTKVKGTHKYFKKSVSAHFLYRIFLLYWLKHRRQFGWRHTSVLPFPWVYFARFSPTKTTPFTALSICYNKELNYWFFASSLVNSTMKSMTTCPLMVVRGWYCMSNLLNSIAHSAIRPAALGLLITLRSDLSVRTTTVWVVVTKVKASFSIEGYFSSMPWSTQLV